MTIASSLRENGNQSQAVLSGSKNTRTAPLSNADQLGNSKQIADWMYETVQQNSRLHQKRVVRVILERFGEEYLYRNKRKHWAIKAEILDEFRKLSAEDIVWSTSGKYWRLRKPKDPEGKRLVRM